MTQSNIQEPLLVSSDDASRLLRISSRTLWQRSAPRGPIPVVKLGSLIRFDVEDLKKFIEASKVRPEPAANPPEEQASPAVD